MAIDVFTKAWAVAAPSSSKPIAGHPLCPRFGFLFGDGAIIDIVSNVRGVSTGPTPGTWSSSAARGYAGRAREHTGTTDYDVLGLDSVLLPTSNCTIILGIQKTPAGDTTGRNAVAFGNETNTTGQFCAGYVPFTDQNVYWDFGGEVAGTTRLNFNATGLYSDDIWAFTTGPRGMEIYQNGVLRTSNAANPTRSQGNVNFQIGRHKTGTIPSDLAKYKLLFIYHTQLTPKQCDDLARNPYQWVARRS